MAEYEYNGCVTGFSESDTVTIWQPVLLPYTVEHEDNEYSQRLLDVLLLENSLPVVESPAIESPAIESPAIESPAIESPAIESPIEGYSGSGWWKDPNTGVVYCKDVPEGETHIFEGDPKEYISVYTKEDAVRFAERAATSNITDMSFMFYGTPFNQPIGHWDVSSVTNMSYMLAETLFNQPIGHWDVSNVTDMSFMFYGTPFNQPIGHWDVSSVTNMSYMLAETLFNQPIGHWDVSSVTNMSYMLAYTQFNQDISNWCVAQFPAEPNYFAIESLLAPENYPVWGTCPRGENRV